MNKYVKLIEKNEIIFKNKIDNTQLTITHFDKSDTYDAPIINKNYDLDFIDFVIKELKRTNDIVSVMTLYDNYNLENMLVENGFRSIITEYIIDYNDYNDITKYETSNDLNKESKEYYLNMLNRFSRINQSVFYPNEEYKEYNDDSFHWDNGYIYKIYKQDGKIVGMVDYIIFEEKEELKEKESYNNYNGKLCIRGLFSDKKDILEDIIKDLLNEYKKDIVINVSSIDDDLNDIVNKLNGKFKYRIYDLKK